jgi:hypothetical protein
MYQDILTDIKLFDAQNRAERHCTETDRSRRFSKWQASCLSKRNGSNSSE